MRKNAVFWSTSGIFDYVFGMLGDHFTEQFLLPPIRGRTILQSFLALFMQGLCNCLFFLYPLLQILKKRVIICKSLLEEGKRKEKNAAKHSQTKRICRKRYIPIKRTKKGNKVEFIDYREDSTEKIKVLILITILAILSILSKLFLYSSLEYTSYTTISIVRSFKLFPIPFILLSSNRNSNFSAKSRVSIIFIIIGVFTYIFAPSEKIENILFLQKIAEHTTLSCLEMEDKFRLIRLFLQFFAYSSKDELLHTPQVLEEGLFINQILSGHIPEQEREASIEMQITKYYRGIVSLYKSDRVQESIEIHQLLEYLVKKGQKGQEKKKQQSIIDAFALVCIRTILNRRNSLYFKAFLERKKMIAGMLLFLHSWTELLLEAGQVTLFKLYTLEYSYFSYALNFFSALISWLVLCFSSCKGIQMHRNVPKSLLLSIIFVSLSRFFSFKITGGRKPVLYTSLQLGKKFFSIVISTVFYCYNISIEHCMGLLFIFIGYMVDINMHMVLLSRKTFKGYLKRKCL